MSTTYKVTGAAAVVELDDGKPELGSGRRVYLDHGVPVPAEAKKAHVEHLLNVGLIEKADAPVAAEEPVSEPEGDTPDEPAKTTKRN